MSFLPSLQSLRKQYLSADQLFFDIGSTSTRVILNKTLVFNEPTCLAIHTQSGSVVAIGEKAAALLGKTAASIKVIFPIKAGVVAYPEYCQLFLEEILKRVKQKSSAEVLLGYAGAVVVPAQISPVAKKALQTILKSAGMQSVELVSNPIALFNTIAGPVSLSHSICVIDIGGQKTDIAVVSAGEVVAAKTFRFGGVECTEAMQETIRLEEACVVGWKTVEDAKKSVARIYTATVKPKSQKTVVRGKDMVNNGAKTIVITSALFDQVLAQKTSVLLQYVQQFFGLLPSELAASILQKGIYLTGGSSLIPGLQELLQEQFQCECIVLPQPFQASVQGLANQ